MPAACLFCRLARQEIPADILFSDDDVVVFKDIHPKALIHYLLIPKKHITSIAHLRAADQALMGKAIYTLKMVAEKVGLNASGFKIVVNNGRPAGQVVDHLHFHILGGGPVSGWPV